MELKLTTRTQCGTTVLAVDGEIDIHTAPALRQKFTELDGAGSRDVVVDLSAVRFLDSSALGTLVGANKDLSARGGSLKLVCSSPNLLKIFEITRLSEVIPVYDTVAGACGGG